MSIVCSVQIHLMEHELKDAVDRINEFYRGNEPELTVEEVLANKRLLEFICLTSYIDNTCNTEECWSDDEWFEWKDYR